MNPLRHYFENNQGRLIHKWDHYFEIYHKHFSRFVGKSPKILEIGVSHGGSLEMWKHYFGPGALIVRLDMNQRCAMFEDAETKIRIGNQSDRNFMRKFGQDEGPFDVVIDDGGHRMTEQIVSMEELFPSVIATGVYLVEDLHTSYWSEFGGGLERVGSFVEYAKRLIDQVNGWHLREGRGVTDFTESVFSMSFYDSVLVVEKRPRGRPFSRATGHASF